MGQRVGVGELLVFFELRLHAFQLGRFFTQRACHLPAVVDRRIRRHRHGADDLLQEFPGDHGTVVQAFGRLAEDLSVFLDVVALIAQDAGNVFQFPGDHFTRLCDDVLIVVLGEIFAADAVELVL
jgi:hypothetical protein